ncbi:FAD binding domain in molybdopterin dehydrogenase [Planctomycetes bacterium Pan216]|uniref:FAD binding domain in molybdopterin dehydrogenase n=1 Tax=Kolteria novifilia TaxID=2527975 RepID=A0A518AX02_9BACT|nr:FAD binding domain in molybdopterin dehydrogenase [Planctomycetes bacterium Pan216]
MDLHTITTVLRPSGADEVQTWADGHAWLAGGTWLFSEPQVHTDTLIDLEGFGWEPLKVSDAGLEIAATCRIVQLDNFKAPPDWVAAGLIPRCCRSFLASYKIWNEATVGGNLVMSLPAGPMISLTSALEGVCTLWSRDGTERRLPVAEFVTGDNRNALRPGELVRSIHLPLAALRKPFAFRRFTLTNLGRSEALLIGTRDPDDAAILLTVTAATLRPYQFRFPAGVSNAEVRNALDGAIADDRYLDDTHGSPRHRKHLTYLFAEQIRAELGV